MADYRSDAELLSSESSADELDVETIVPGSSPQPVIQEMQSVQPTVLSAKDPDPQVDDADDDDDDDDDDDGVFEGEFGALGASMKQRKQRQRAHFDAWSQQKRTEIKKQRVKMNNGDTDEDRLPAQSMIESKQRIIENPREYQLELFEVAKGKNTIAVLDTGSGKTLIACLLLQHVVDQELQDRMAGKPRRVSFFLVDGVTLVFQQASVLEANLDCKVGKYCGAMGVDFWSREQWVCIMEKQDVIVLTADILYNCFTHGLIKMKEINLICFDEVHHAKKNHVYARIIRDFYIDEPEAMRPKLFGMTASPVDSRTDVLEAALDLEKLLHSRISTASDLKLLQNSVNRPYEQVLSYPKSGGRFKTQLYDQLYEKYSKINCFKRIFAFAFDCTAELGGWCADEVWKVALSENEAVKIETRNERLLSREKNEKYIAKVEMEIQMIREAREIVENHEFITPDLVNAHITPKVQKLNDFLFSVFEHNTDDKCIIFVTQRYTAHVLAKLLKAIGPPHMSLGVLIGARSGKPGEENVTFRQQMLTVCRFRKGKYNCLIATSVAEEGLDIPDCSQIVRFDLYTTMIQYIQSRGRARHAQSKYVQMVEMGNRDHLNRIMEVRNAESTMRDFCQQLPADRKLKPPDNYTLVSRSDTFYIEPSTGAKLTYSAALQLIWHFVGNLPKESESIDPPTYYYWPTNEQAFICELILPPTSPIVSIQGKPCPTKAEAKQSAAFTACVKLREMGHLDEHLRPERPRKAIPEGANSLLSIDNAKANMYTFRAKPSFWDVKDKPLPDELYVTVFGLVDPEAMGRPYQPLCVLTRDKLPEIPQFTVHADLGGKSEVYSITLNSTLPLNADQLAKLNTFTFRFFYDLFNKTFEINENIPYWILPVKHVPVNMDSKIEEILDNDLIALVMQKTEQEWNHNTPDEFFQNKFLLHRLSRSRRFFTHHVVPDLFPSSQVPPGACTAPGTPTIYDYSHFARGRDEDWVRDDIDRKQPVLKATRVLHRINYLDPATQRDTTTALLAYIVPSAFEVSCFPPSFASFGIVFPSISTRLDAFLHAWDVCRLVGVNLSLGIALEAITKDSDNTHEHDAEQKNVKKGMTSNYERLEFLGDTFLKLATTLSLIVSYEGDDEYQLHVKRMRMVCNSNLFENARKNNLTEYIQTQGFSRREWYPQMKLLKGKRIKKKKQAANGANGADSSQAVTGQTDVQHKHKLAPKTIADVCEALIGAAVHDKGFDEAIKVVNIMVDNPDHDKEKFTCWDSYHSLYIQPAYVTVQPLARHLVLAENIEQKIGYKFTYPRLLASAFIHPSIPFAWEGTPNYQRLEFLGDALHDQACIRYIYDKYPDKNPQWLTEHKMAMVSNKFLAMLSVKLEFHKHLRRNGTALQQTITNFVRDVEVLEANYKGAVDFWSHLNDAIPKSLGDCLEAFIGAMFVDSGFQFQVVQDFFEKFIKPYFIDMSVYDTYAGNHPTTLLTTKMSEFGCEYWRILSKDDPDSQPDPNNPNNLTADGTPSPVILAAVMVHGEVFAHGSAANVKNARVKASQNALEKLKDTGLQSFLKICNCATARERLRTLKATQKEKEMEKKKRMREQREQQKENGEKGGASASEHVSRDGDVEELDKEMTQLQIEVMGRLSVDGA